MRREIISQRTLTSNEVYSTQCTRVDNPKPKPAEEFRVRIEDPLACCSVEIHMPSLIADNVRPPDVTAVLRR
jgi:hypothetical protein